MGSPSTSGAPLLIRTLLAVKDGEIVTITPQFVALVVMDVLNQRAGTVTTEIVLRPQRLLLKKGLRK